ncbi:MAG: DeoR/GlpR transcriptional regulator [Anaerolineae bacterium]|nr:DeoR/GlpR transcriptional regulator [Anaerolineae bacterium]
MPDLLKEERLQLILETVQTHGRATVSDLSRRFNVSEVTIRRDLRELAGRGLVRRAHGGAVPADPLTPEPPVVRRMLENAEHKKRIGRAAAALISNGASVFIGSGSTNLYLARCLLERQDLTVVTNALNVAAELAAAGGVTVVVLGGMMRASELSLVGHITEQAIKEVRVDKAIIGIPAIDIEAGLTNDYLPEVMTDRAIIASAPELVLVADHSKFGKVASAYLAPVERITTLVTDDQTDPAILDRIRALGVRVIVAE